MLFIFRWTIPLIPSVNEAYSTFVTYAFSRKFCLAKGVYWSLQHVMATVHQPFAIKTS